MKDDPVSVGRRLCGDRYDDRIDYVELHLGLANADMQRARKTNTEEYRRFMEEVYQPTKQRIQDYLSGKTDEHPCKRIGRLSDLLPKPWR